MEAATSPWRPIGQFLVERHLITEAELEQALAEQEETGGRLGEILVARGWISGPALAAAVSEQLGIELETESGFGAGLFDEIRRRHAAVRGLATTPEPEPAAGAEKPQLHLVEPEEAPASPADELAALRARVAELEQELERERAARGEQS
jgi:HAMP domain-containing protein